MEKKPLSIKEALKSGIIEQRTYQKAEQSRVGRKKKEESQKAKHSITIYLTQEQKDSLQNIAEKESETIGYLCKKIILKHLKEKS